MLKSQIQPHFVKLTKIRFHLLGFIFRNEKNLLIIAIDSKAVTPRETFSVFSPEGKIRMPIFRPLITSGRMRREKTDNRNDGDEG